ncbi:MAG: hypothetical protein DRN71_03715 [Candidatus Nanohalarchaeota archaeon]|nr:MAG: hypothetical protein DRN71_03715 [Candidatus Nanohaloarchaeota archaeon]
MQTKIYTLSRQAEPLYPYDAFFELMMKKAGIPDGIQKEEDAKTYQDFFNKNYKVDLIGMRSDNDIDVKNSFVSAARTLVTNPEKHYRKTLSKIYLASIQNTDYNVMPRHQMIPSLLTTTHIGEIKENDYDTYLEADTEKMVWLWPDLPKWLKEFFS